MSIFKVNAVSIIPHSRNSQDEAVQGRIRSDKASGSFASALNKAVESQNALPCETYTYGSNSQLQHFQYQTREYKY